MLLNLETSEHSDLRTHRQAAVAAVQTHFQPCGPQTIFASLRHTNTHTYHQLLSVCELHWEAMKVFNDAVWQPVKPERDEDAIRLSSTLELLPTNWQKERKERRFYFEGRGVFSGWADDFCADVWHDIKWLRDDDHCVRSAASCICWLWVDSAPELKGQAEDEVSTREK